MNFKKVVAYLLLINTVLYCQGLCYSYCLEVHTLHNDILNSQTMEGTTQYVFQESSVLPANVLLTAVNPAYVNAHPSLLHNQSNYCDYFVSVIEEFSFQDN